MKRSVTATEMLKLFNSSLLSLAVDKLHDVGMVHPQDGHVGPPAGAALFDLLGGGVEDAS
jgi:hypothetical protein